MAQTRRVREIIIYAGVAAAIVTIVALLFRYVGEGEDFGRTYVTGLLVFEDFSICGVVKSRNQDWQGCQLSPESCANLRSHANRRIRLSARKADCGVGIALQCSFLKEFNEPGFQSTVCYDSLKLVKVFEGG